MSRTNFATSVLIAALALSVAGCASSPREQSLDAKQVASNQRAPSTAGCAGDTGSRIKPKEGECRPGRTYTQEDLQRTGDINAADALRRLDPSIQ
jgi:Flp pilus assembly protein TadD